MGVARSGGEGGSDPLRTLERVVGVIVSLLVVLTCVVLALARVMAQAVDTRRDVEATT